MKLTKKLTALGLAVAMLASISATSVFASEVSSNNFNTSGQGVSALEIQTENDDITGEFSEMTRSVNTVISTPFIGGSESWDKSFSTNSNQPAYQVKVTNTGTSKLTVFVKKDSENGKTQTSFTVEPGQTVNSSIMVTDNLFNSPGTRYVVITSENGAEYKGSVTVRIANSKDEF